MDLYTELELKLSSLDKSVKMLRKTGEAYALAEKDYKIALLVGGIVLQATYRCRGVEEGKTLLLAECHDIINLKTLGIEVHEMVLVAKEHLPFYAPVVVDEVGIIEVHAPPFALWRKTA